MANEQVVQNFGNLYDKLYARFKPSYTPQSASTLKDTLSRAMRPSYDKQIKQRQEAAAANRAAIDTDAAARGMGSSTWVTDVKNRQRNAEASDIQGINSDYNAALYSALLNRLNAQDELSLSAENAARSNALGLAQGLYDKVYGKTGSGGGGGWGRGSGTPKVEDPQGDYADALAALKKAGYTTKSAVDYLMKGTDLQKVASEEKKKAPRKTSIITPGELRNDPVAK